MIELLRYEFERLRTDEEFNLYRGRRTVEPSCERPDDVEPSSILVLSPILQQPEAGTIKRLDHECSFRDELDPEWSVRPIGLTRHWDRTVLVLEDPGGEPFDRFLGARNPGPPSLREAWRAETCASADPAGQSMELTRFLRLTISLAAGLNKLHGRGLIHKDVKPANILVDSVTDKLWFTGFGISSRLVRERQADEPAETIAGTLAYMAPEQTGRMNRSIDSRTDLYSLGVTFYEMLTGSLPFTASDPMEWVHCHIARQPPAPGGRVENIPAPVSAIITKLLAKTAEERYQTAAGVEADLRRCLAQWETQGRIDDFILGQHDTPDRLMIPEKLYGRAREIDILLASFGRVVRSGRSELVLISGYSGIGKSSVINELHKALVPLRGLFASGKFDQFKRDIPYSTLAQAFQSLIRPLLVKGEAELDKWRAAFREALGPNGRLIGDLVPELKLIIGEQVPVPELPPQEAQHRFEATLRGFLGVFARKEHPLMLFLDDLQWLDPASLRLLQKFITDPNVRYLLLIGAYRDNEVTVHHPLKLTLAEIRETDAIVREIVLKPLSLADVNQLIADALHCDLAYGRPLADLVHEQTQGNPFFIIEFLTALAEERLLAFEPREMAWGWDMDRIRARGFTDNVADFMIAELRGLPAVTQEALKQFACFGNSVETRVFAMVCDKSENQVGMDLWEAVRSGLVLRQGRSYRFRHDRIQEAAYALIPEELRPRMHLGIGRLLTVNMAAADVAEHIFDIVNQLNSGVALISESDEKERVAELNLTAGKKAKASAAYASAINYFSAGMALIDEWGWEKRYELTFSLWYECAECQFHCGNFAEALQYISELLSRAKSNIDRAAANRLKIDLHMVQSDNLQAVRIGIDCLRIFGVELPIQPTREQVQTGYEKVWLCLGERSVESLIDLPLMTDPDMRALMGVLTVLTHAAYLVDTNLTQLLICQMVGISLQYGTTDASAFAYVGLGMFMSQVFHRQKDADRFAELAIRLVEKYQFSAWKPDIYFVAQMVVPFTRPIKVAIDFLEVVYRTAIDTGDLVYACYSLEHKVAILLTRGDSLDQVWLESVKALDFAQKAKFRQVADVVTGIQSFIRYMQGQEVLSAYDSAKSAERKLAASDGKPQLVCFEWILELRTCFMAGKNEPAIFAAEKAEPLLWSAFGHVQTLDFYYFAGLAIAGASQTAGPESSSRTIEALKHYLEPLEEWAQTCPETFFDKYALLSAESARLEGRDSDAMRLYEEAIRTARENGFVQDEAIANELAARFYARRGFAAIAHAYLRNARHCYLRWGANGKVCQLEELYPHLREEAPVNAPTKTIGAPVEHLDLATVIKVSQAVSGEILLEKVIETLLRFALEHAGADRGVLILPHGEQHRIEAEITTLPDQVRVQFCQLPVTSPALPESLFRYVIRTQERVILDDASAQNLFSQDEYLRQRRPRSVLCLPLAKQTKLIGVLYLENSLAPRVFTAKRLTVLELLASQAAISLDHARLYSELSRANEELRREINERQRAEAALRRSEAYSSEAQRISHTGSWGWEVSSGKICWSEETFQIFGLNPATEPTPELVLQRTHPEDRALVRQAMDRVLYEGKVDPSLELRLLMPDGSIKHLRLWGRPSINESGSFEMVGAVTDVTEQKQSEEALRASEERWRKLFENSSAGIGLIAPDGRHLAANLALQKMLGYTNEELQGITTADLMSVEDYAAYQKARNEVLAGRRQAYRAERRFRRKDGTVICTDVSAVLVPATGSQPAFFAVVIVDISERKRAEEELRRSEAFLAQGQQISHTASWAWKVATELLYWSEEHFRIFGLDPEIDKPSYSLFMERVHSEDRAPFEELLNRAVREKSDFESEYRIVLPDGSIKFLRTLGQPRVSSSGELEYIGTVMDITERKRAEEAWQKAQAELAHVSRVTTMGELAASIAHEVKQPLAGVVMNASAGLRWLARDSPDLAEARKALLAILRDGNRGGDVLSRMRSLFKKACISKQRFNINEAIEEVVTLTQAEARSKKVGIRTELDANLPAVTGDRVQVQQVLMNLILNGIEAMSSVEDRGRDLVIRTQPSEGGRVRVAVQDSGIGLVPPSGEQIFDAFYTTKPGGLGMGLSISRSIVETHGGQLWATANDGPGATFQFTL